MIEVQEQKHKLHLWDTTGRDNFRTITKAFIRGTACIFLVYDITSRDSFSHISQWITDAKQCCNPSALQVLIGNKLDLLTERMVSSEEATECAETNGLLYFETSAISGENIASAFEKSCSTILDRIRKGYLKVGQHNGVWLDRINDSCDKGMRSIPGQCEKSCPCCGCNTNQFYITICIIIVVLFVIIFSCLYYFLK